MRRNRIEFGFLVAGPPGLEAGTALQRLGINESASRAIAYIPDEGTADPVLLWFGPLTALRPGHEWRREF